MRADAVTQLYPLQNKRIAITRAAGQADGLAERLRAQGAVLLLCPAIAIAPPDDYGPLDAALARLAGYDWLLVTSANAARALLDRLDALGLDVAALAGLRVGAVGPATAAALAERGILADFVPHAHLADAILAEIGDVAGRRFLLPRADIAREALAAGLRARGALVDDIAAYRTIPGPGPSALAPYLRGRALDAVTFSSPSTVRYTLAGLEGAGLPRAEALALLAGVAVVCIGPVTAEAARAEGLAVAAVAHAHTADGLAQALVEALAS